MEIGIVKTTGLSLIEEAEREWSYDIRFCLVATEGLKPLEGGGKADLGMSEGYTSRCRCWGMSSEMEAIAYVLLLLLQRCWRSARHCRSACLKPARGRAVCMGADMVAVCVGVCI